MKVVALAALTAAGLWAQNPAPPVTPAPKPAAAQPDDEQQAPERKREVYVRRIAIGVTAGATLPQATKNETLDQNFSTVPHLEIQSNNSGKSKLPEFGLSLQVAITQHFAVAITPLMRTGIKMEFTTVRLVGTDNVNTIQDDRAGTTLTGSTTARFLDVPILLRYYGKSRYERGHRWFVELGPRARTALAVRTSTHVVPPPNTIAEYDTTNPVAYKKRIIGGSAGFGLQFIDDFGIHFVPEVRYTRWFGSTFGDVTGRSRSSQFEILFTLSF